MRGRSREAHHLFLNHNSNTFPSSSSSVGSSVGSSDSRVASVGNNNSNGSNRPSSVRGTSSSSKNVTGRNGCRHTKRSPSERRFKCDQIGCEKIFFTRKDVKRHMVVHTGQRNFPCPFCQQRFGRKDHLVRHAKKSHNRDTRTSALNAYASTSGSAPSSSSLHHHHQPFLPPPPPSSASSSSSLKTMTRSGQNPLRDSSSHTHSGSNGHPCCPPSSSPHDHPSILILAGNGNNSYHHSPHQGVSDAHQFSSMMAQHHHNLQQQQAHAEQLHQSLVNSQSVQSSSHSVAQVPHPAHHHHSMVKTETGSSTPSYFTFPSTPPFPSHSLMSHPYSPRSLYPSPGPSAFSVNVPGMPPSLPSSQLSVMCGDQLGPHPPSAMTFSVPENPQLPHFSQAFQLE